MREAARAQRAQRFAEAPVRAWESARERARASIEESVGATNANISTMGGQVAILMALAAAATGLALSLGRVAFSAAESVVQMAAFRESTLTSMGTILGGGSRGAQAQSAFRWAGTVARQTPLDERSVVEVMRQAATGGFRDTMLRAVAAAATDVGSANPQDSTAASRFIVAVSQLRGSSSVRAQELNQLREVGIGREAMLRALASVSGTAQRRGELDPAFMQRIQAMQEHGRFTGAQGAQAALLAVRNVLDAGGPLGQFAKNQSGTLGGVLSNVNAAVFSLVTSINDLEGLPGIRAFKGFLGNLMDLVGVGSKGGTVIQSVIVRAINAVGGLFNRLDGKAMSKGLAVALDVVNGLGGALRVVLPLVTGLAGGFTSGLVSTLGPVLGLVRGMKDSGPGANVQMMAVAFTALGKALGWIVGIGVQGVGFFFAVGGAIAAATAATLGLAQTVLQLGGVFLGGGVRLGAAIIDGIISGLTTGVTRVRDAMAEVATSTLDSAKSVLGIASPSRVFRDEVGAQIGAGISLGIGDSAGGVRGALDGVFALPSFPAGLGGGGATIGGVTVNVEINGGGGLDIREQARAGVVEGLVEVFDLLALQGGG